MCMFVRNLRGGKKLITGEFTLVYEAPLFDSYGEADDELRWVAFELHETSTQ
jgi:hypothetical protein